MAMFKIGLAVWSFGKTLSLDDLEKQFALAREIRVKSVQLWAVDYDGAVDCFLDPERYNSNFVEKRFYGEQFFVF